MNPSKKSHAFSPAGSPVEGEPAFLVIGKIRRSHGVHGDVLMEVISDFPERIQAGVTVYVGESAQPLEIVSCRTHKDGLIIRFAAYDNPESVSVLRNTLVFVRSEDRPLLAPGEYYHHQLLGLQVNSDEHEVLGRVVEILETGANDVFVVQSEDGKKIYIPYADEFIKEID
ncbi:MAG: ribosome maturation factor RimM, partial [Anaerolineales bacterium]